MEIDKINQRIIDTNLYKAKVSQTENDFEKQLTSAFDKGNKQELKKACQGFESIFLNMMLKQMRNTIIKSDLIPEDSGTQTFQSMLDEKLVDESSKNGSFGLADMIYKNMEKQLKNKYEVK